MEEKELLLLYEARDRRAVRETAKQYGGYCFKIADNILRSPEDSEECVNDTWLKAWNAIPPAEPRSLRLFLAKITRSLAFNRREKAGAQKRGGGELPLVLEELAECIPGEETVEGNVELKELGALISRFLRGLPERERGLFLRRYFRCEDLKTAAEAYGITPNHAAVILGRVRKKLKETLRKEGYEG